MAKTLTYADLRAPETAEAQKLIDFYEGAQQKHLQADLDAYRKDWQGRKFIARVRNITKAIVDKSGLLFNAPPKFEIIEFGKTVPVNDPTFDELMDRSDWIEFFQNIDVYTRLLKSTCVLQQKYVPTSTVTSNGKYSPNFGNGDALLLTMLTRANSAVVLDITGTLIVEVAFLTSNITAAADFTYRDITPELVTDWQVKNGIETIIKSRANEDGFVPASMVYDVNRPRSGAWVNPPEDIISLQEMVNLSLTDTEFAIAHQKQKTLFTNATVVGSSNKGSSQMMHIPHAEEGFTPAGTNYPSAKSGIGSSEMGGLGNVVTVTAPDASIAPFVKFDGPVSDLLNLTQVMEQLAKGVAYDWAVNMRMEGSGKANSGFQIIVEEMDNLQLREKRAQSMQAALRRFYMITQRLYPTLTQGSLRAKWAPPSLPVNTNEQEVLWSNRIAEGRASVLDYFMEVQGLGQDAAWEKILEIQQVNAKLGYAVTMTATEQASSPIAKMAPAGAASTPSGTP